MHVYMNSWVIIRLWDHPLDPVEGTPHSIWLKKISLLAGTCHRLMRPGVVCGGEDVAAAQMRV